MVEDKAAVEALELSIDSASEIASVALTRAGSLLAERTWKCGREQSRQLLPAIDELLTHHGETKDGVTAVFVCIGPGTYAGVRACVSIAKGLAYGLELPGGLFTRAERVLLLGGGLIISQVRIALWILAVMANVTVLQRLYVSWDRLRRDEAMPPDAKRPDEEQQR